MPNSSHCPLRRLSAGARTDSDGPTPNVRKAGVASARWRGWLPGKRLKAAGRGGRDAKSRRPVARVIDARPAPA